MYSGNFMYERTRACRITRETNFVQWNIDLDALNESWKYFRFCNDCKMMSNGGFLTLVIFYQVFACTEEQQDILCSVLTFQKKIL